jgi:ketosteroid isomerase-like protein
MRHATKHPADTERITDLLDAYAAAIRARDARATVACYTRDAVAFDLAPPLKIQPDAIRDLAYIQQWFDTWDGPIGTEGRDRDLAVGGDVAYAFELRHMTGTKTDGKTVDLWFRSTACVRRDDGDWKIAHIHNSVPFAMDGSDRALLDLEP